MNVIIIFLSAVISRVTVHVRDVPGDLDRLLHVFLLIDDLPLALFPAQYKQVRGVHVTFCPLFRGSLHSQELPVQPDPELP